MRFYKKNSHVCCNCFIVIPADAKYQDEVTPFIGNLTTDTMKEVLTELTSFRNRYYKSSYGAKSCRWLIQQIRDVADGFDHVSVKEFEHSVSVVCYTHTQLLIVMRFMFNSGINSPLLLVLRDLIRILRMNLLS